MSHSKLKRGLTIADLEHVTFKIKTCIRFIHDVLHVNVYLHLHLRGLTIADLEHATFKIKTRRDKHRLTAYHIL